MSTTAASWRSHTAQLEARRVPRRTSGTRAAVAAQLDTNATKGNGYRQVDWPRCRRGDATVVPQIAVSRLTERHQRRGITSFPDLTRREREILALMANGHGNTYIADYFVLSLKTVRNHFSPVMAKIGAATRAEAVA